MSDLELPPDPVYAAWIAEQRTGDLTPDLSSRVADAGPPRPSRLPTWAWFAASVVLAGRAAAALLILIAG